MIIIVRRILQLSTCLTPQGAFNAAKDPANDRSVAGSAGGNMAIAFFYIVRCFLRADAALTLPVDCVLLRLLERHALGLLL